MLPWRTILLPDSLIVHNVGRTNQINSAEIKATGRYPVVDQGQDFIAGFTDEPSPVVRKGLPYVIFGDHTRCFKYVDFPFVLGADGTKVLKPDPNLFDTKFFYYAGLALDIPNRGYNRHFTLLKEKLIPRPELPEQRQIARLLSAVQQAIERQERLIALTAELKKALMHKLFTEGTRGEPLKQTEIGRMPKSWRVMRGSEAFAIQKGQVDPKRAPFCTMPHIGPEDVEPNSGRLITLRTNAELGISSGNYFFSAEHIIYSKIRPYLNKAVFPRCEGTCSADMYPLLPDKNHFLTEFLFQYLLSPSFVKQASSHQDRTGIPKINRNQLNSVLLPNPDVAEQALISSALSDCDQKLDVHMRVAASLRALFRTLLRQLMTAKIRVHDLDLSALEEPAAKTAEAK